MSRNIGWLGAGLCAQSAGRARVLGERAQVGGRRKRAAAGSRTRQGRAERAAGRGHAEREGQGWLGAGRAAWARGLALGSALGALGPFLIRFDSVFSRVKFFGHCS